MCLRNTNSSRHIRGRPNQPSHECQNTINNSSFIVQVAVAYVMRGWRLVHRHVTEKRAVSRQRVLKRNFPSGDLEHVTVN